jgi:hypothetical protein
MKFLKPLGFEPSTVDAFAVTVGDCVVGALSEADTGHHSRCVIERNLVSLRVSLRFDEFIVASLERLLKLYRFVLVLITG